MMYSSSVACVHSAFMLKLCLFVLPSCFFFICILVEKRPLDFNGQDFFSIPLSAFSLSLFDTFISF
jgi:hypothetical protein